MITKLILLNGPPGVGKSALARRYVNDHPLTLQLEIDAIRVALGGWEEHDESKLIARTLAMAMAEVHLRAGHDVVVPQYLGRIEFIDALDELVRAVRIEFVEVVVLDTAAAARERFDARRVAMSATGERHPQLDVDERSVPDAIAESFVRLKAVQTARTNTQVITATNGLEEAYRELLVALGETTH